MTLYTKDPNFNPDLLKRTEEMEAKYKKHLVNCNHPIANIKNPAEYIIDTEFQHKNQLLAFSPNGYPYDLPEGQSHWILWVKDEFLQQDYRFTQPLDVLIPQLIFWHFPRKKVFAIWQNEPEKQSVKDLTHFHFILLD